MQINKRIHKRTVLKFYVFTKVKAVFIEVDVYDSTQTLG
jgi:hypothetical protein